MIQFIPTIFLILSILEDKINGETEMKCTEEYCKDFVSQKGCPELHQNCVIMNFTHNGIFLDYPDVCNCCEFCIPHLNSGENCMKGYPGSQPELVSVCGHKLSCELNNGTSINDTSTCQSIKTDCTRAQNKWDNRRIDGTLGMMEVRPVCDNDGNYAPAHCIPGSICYCLSPENERIFGETPFLDSSNEQAMTCGCALNEWKMRKILDIERWNKENYSPAVFSARCTATGQYDPLQCFLGDDPKCFCVDPVTGGPNQSISEIVDMKNIRDGRPQCFDPSKHVPGIYNRPCESMKMPSGRNTFDNPICQPDGMFDRLQTLATKKICVDPSGEQISFEGVKYEANLKSHKANDMNCNCARNIWLLSSVGVSELPNCCSNGNFVPWQCRRNFCYCVDQNGNQESLEVIQRNVSKLSCYNVEQLC